MRTRKITSPRATKGFLAVDTETTGLDLRHGCKPFIVSTCTPEGKIKSWEAAVHPVTREPRFSFQEKTEIGAYLSGHTLVFHHAKFDLRALSELGFEVYFHTLSDLWDDWLVPVSKRHKGKVIRIVCPSFEDTMLASHATSSSDEHGLKALATRYLRISDDDETELKQAVSVATRIAKSRGIEVSLGKDPVGKRQTGYDYWLPKVVDPKSDVCLKYANRDVERTILLWSFYQDLMKELKVEEQYEKERRLMPVVYKMESCGISYNKTRASKKIRSLGAQQIRYRNQATRWASRIMGCSEQSFNIDSPKQMQELLYGQLGLSPPHQTKKGQDSVDAKAMEKLLESTSHKHSPQFHPPTSKFLRSVMLSRKYGKGVQSILSYEKYGIEHPGYPDYAVLYPSLNQMGAQNTTRFSSSNPNGQNISKVATIDVAGVELEGPRVRDIFAPLPDEVWYGIDYSQLELRIFAFVSQEKSLIQALEDGYDFHSYVATRIFKKPEDKITKQERRIAKNTNFAIIFGASPWKVNLTAGINDAYELFAGQFPNVHSFMQDMISQARRDRYITTVDGYRLDVPHDAPYKAVSYKVQGTAGRIIKNAMVKIDEIGLVDWRKSHLRLQIHDELVVSFNKRLPSIPTHLHDIMQTMEQAGRDMGIYTPVSCEEIKDCWGKGKEVTVIPPHGPIRYKT